MSGDQAYAVSTTQVGGVTHFIAGTSGQDVTANLTGGSLGGILAARDQQIPAFQIALDTLAYSLGTQVNLVNAQGNDAYSSPGQAIFQLPGTGAGAAALITMATSDPNAIAAAAVEGPTGNSNALLLAQIASGKIVVGQTATGFFSSLLAQIGSAAAGATSDKRFKH